MSPKKGKVEKISGAGNINSMRHKRRMPGCRQRRSPDCRTLDPAVYGIYKVGHDLHWVEGMDILGQFGFDLVVIPHWNNAEGRTHDTRFCFMGEPRFRRLESLIPEEMPVL